MINQSLPLFWLIGGTFFGILIIAWLYRGVTGAVGMRQKSWGKNTWRK